MKNRQRVSDFWDAVLSNWEGRSDMSDLPDVLKQWRKSYKGEVDFDSYPEGFVGDLRGESSEPRIVTLGLNPGIGYPYLMGPSGVWTREIKRRSYSKTIVERIPFANAEWTALHGRNSRYWANLINFGRRWLKDEKFAPSEILNFEMFPFHSPNLRGAIVPSSGIVDEYIWSPLREMKTNLIFAFGADWCRTCSQLLGEPFALYGKHGGSLIDKTWQLRLFRLDDKVVVVSWQQGYAGPPVRNLGTLRGILVKHGCVPRTE